MEALAGEERIGPYVLLRRLGAGGMGQVFLAASPGGRLTALKVVRPELADDPAFRARFDREVRACRAVSGAFTASVVDADPGAPTPWLATAYVAGPSLQEAVRQFGPLGEDTVTALAAGLAEALVAIHRAGLVHRDLKPGNVLVAEDGPRVIDFGISRAMDGTVLTRNGMVLGSPGYMAPEQVAATGDVGPAADVFALGATLVFALTGAGPFGSGTPASVLYRAVNNQPNLDGVPAGLVPPVAACLEKDPARRPTPDQILGELEGGKAWPPPVLRAELRRRQEEAAALLPGTSGMPSPSVHTAVLSQAPRIGGTSRRRVLGMTGAAVAGVAGLAGIAWLSGSGTARRGDAHGAAGPGGRTAPATVRPAGPGGQPLPIWTYDKLAALVQASLATMGDLIVAATPSAGVSGIDASTGTTRWHLPGSFDSHPIGTRIASPGIVYVSGGTVYCVMTGQTPLEQSLMAVDPRSGRLRSIGLLAQGTQMTGPIVAMSGSVLLFDITMGSPADTRFAAFDVAAGRTLWTRPRTGNVFPAVAADRYGFYIAENGSDHTTSSLVALEARSGRRRWGMPQSGVSGRLLTVGDTLVAATGSPAPTAPARLLGLSSAGGAVRWQLEMDPMAQVTADSTRIYLLHKDYSVQAIDPVSGTIRWRAKGTGASQLDPPGTTLIAASDQVVAAAMATPRSKGFRVLDPTSGSSAWTYTLPGDISTVYSLAVARDVVCLLTAPGGQGLTGFRA